MDSKRSHYRSTPREGAMGVTLIAGDESIEGRVLNLSVQGAGAHFPLEGVPAVMPGDRVQLRFTSMLLLEPLVAEAAIRRMSEVDGSLRVGFEFTDPRTLLRDVPYVLRPYFNRRRHPRVVFEELIEVEVMAPGLGKGSLTSGWLRQIGVGGAMLTLPRQLAGNCGKRDRVELRFELPGQAQPFWILAVIRGVSQDGDELALSLRFDRLGTVDFKRQRRAIEALVAERWAEARKGQQAP